MVSLGFTFDRLIEKNISELCFPNSTKSGKQLYLAADIDRIEPVNSNFNLIGIIIIVISCRYKCFEGHIPRKKKQNIKSWCFQKLCLL